MAYLIQISLISINQLLLEYDLTCNCLSVSLHSIDERSDLVIFPNSVIASVWISASIGNNPESIYMSGSATFVY